MNNFGNSRKIAFLSNIPQISLDDTENNLTERCKFNFSYFDDSQSAGQKFSDWDHGQLTKLLEKIKEYCKFPLNHWRTVPIGSSLKHRSMVLVEYGDFPNKSDFTHPKHIPHQASWARFRLEWDMRLIGFLIPSEYHNKTHSNTKEFFDHNTFYVVFLDQNHKFYSAEK